jgi:hypothetical protein
MSERLNGGGDDGPSFNFDHTTQRQLNLAWFVQHT